MERNISMYFIVIQSPACLREPTKQLICGLIYYYAG